MMSAVRLPMVAGAAARVASRGRRGRRAGNTATAVALASSSGAMGGNSSYYGGTYGGGVPTFLTLGDPPIFSDMRQQPDQPRRLRRRRRRRESDPRARTSVSSHARRATAIAAASAADASTASTTTTTNDADDANDNDRHLHELPVRVYIEHTDAYQVRRGFLFWFTSVCRRRRSVRYTRMNSITDTHRQPRQPPFPSLCG